MAEECGRSSTLVELPQDTQPLSLGAPSRASRRAVLKSGAGLLAAGGLGAQTLPDAAIAQAGVRPVRT